MEHDAVIDAYDRLRNLKLVGAELGIKWQTVYTILRRNNVPVVGDKIRYGSETDRLAATTEQEFKRLVPDAVSQNEFKYQARIDFMVHGMRVDIKSSRLNRGMKNSPGLRWAFCIKKQEFCADFIVCFGYLADMNYRVFMLPGEMVQKYQSIAIGQEGRSKWLDFEVQPEELAPFFKEAASVAA